MSNRFTLYEADSDNLAISWGPMTFDGVLSTAFELILESDEPTHLLENQLRMEWALYYERENKRALDIAFNDGGDALDAVRNAMTLLCEWLNGQRGGYRYYFTEVGA